MAPTPATAAGTADPTARNFEATATPHDSPSADLATIENVIARTLAMTARPACPQPELQSDDRPVPHRLGFPSVGRHRRFVTAIGIDAIGSGVFMRITTLYFLVAAPRAHRGWASHCPRLPGRVHAAGRLGRDQRRGRGAGDRSGNGDAPPSPGRARSRGTASPSARLGQREGAVEGRARSCPASASSRRSVEVLGARRRRQDDDPRPRRTGGELAPEHQPDRTEQPSRPSKMPPPERTSVPPGSAPGAGRAGSGCRPGRTPRRTGCRRGDVLAV